RAHPEGRDHARSERREQRPKRREPDGDAKKCEALRGFALSQEHDARVNESHESPRDAPHRATARGRRTSSTRATLFTGTLPARTSAGANASYSRSVTRARSAPSTVANTSAATQRESSPKRRALVPRARMLAILRMRS